MKSKITVSILLSLVQILVAQNVPTYWDARGVGGGGAVYSPSISPFDGNECYLSCDMNELFHSLDFGTNWRTLSYDTITGQRNSKVNFTNHPDTQYVLHMNPQVSKYYPSISTDGGTNWRVVPSVSFWTGFAAMRLFANPYSSRQLIVSGYNTIYFSNDWGQTFTSIHTAAAQGSTFLHLAGVLYTNDTIYVSSDKGWKISTDNGNTWGGFVNYSTMGITTSGAGAKSVVNFCGAQKTGTTRFIISTIDATKISVKPKPIDMQYFNGLYKMDVGAGTWTSILSNFQNADAVSNIYNMGWEVAMHANNIDTFYINGQTRWPATAAGARFGTVYKTTDGGSAFSRVFLKDNNPTNLNIYTAWVGGSTYTNWNHTWNSINTIEGICVDPNNINRVMISDFSAVHTTTDGGATWYQKYSDASHQNNPGVKNDRTDIYKTNGLQTTVTYWMHWMDSMHILNGMADLSMNNSLDGGQTWSFDFDSLVYPKVNDAHMICRATDGTLYAPLGEILGNNGDFSEYRVNQAQGGSVVSSTDGIHWHMKKNFKWPASWVSLDPNDASVLYAAVYSTDSDTTGGIWKCDNLPAATHWVKLADPPRTQNRATQIFCLHDGSLVAVYGSLDTGHSVASYYYTNSSGVFISRNGGSSWIDLCATYPGLQSDVRYLMIDTSDASDSTWYISICSNGVSPLKGLYKTTNMGNSWTNMAPGKNVLTCTMHPTKKEMYVCTFDDGLWYATHTDSSAFVFSHVNAYPFRAAERVFFNPYNVNEVWVCSLGNGLRVGYTAADTVVTALPLPVKWLNFTATKKDNDVLLNWSTAVEVNCDKYEIERSIDGRAFEKIGMQNSKTTNGSGLFQYAYTDDDACSFAATAHADYLFYRIKQLDLNGDFEYSHIDNVYTNNSYISRLNVFPQPAAATLYIQFELIAAGDVSFELYDIHGQIVFENVYENMASGINQLSLPLGNFISGNYFAKISSGGSESFVLIKN